MVKLSIEIINMKHTDVGTYLQSRPLKTEKHDRKDTSLRLKRHKLF